MRKWERPSARTFRSCVWWRSAVRSRGANATRQRAEGQVSQMSHPWLASPCLHLCPLMQWHYDPLGHRIRNLLFARKQKRRPSSFNRAAGFTTNDVDWNHRKDGTKKCLNWQKKQTWHCMCFSSTTASVCKMDFFRDGFFYFSFLLILLFIICVLLSSHLTLLLFGFPRSR